MSIDRLRTRSTTDPKLNRMLERKERRRLEIFKGALQVVMQTAEGRFVIWHWLRRAGIDKSVWSPSSEVHYNAGQQDFGFSMVADCKAADRDLYRQMEAELEAWEERLERELTAREQARRPQQQEEDSNGT